MSYREEIEPFLERYPYQEIIKNVNYGTVLEYDKYI